jgi:flagellar protein FlgJ
LQPMFADLSTDGPFGGGHAEKIWRAMMVDEVGKAMAKSGGIGLADYVQREILRVQEAQST